LADDQRPGLITTRARQILQRIAHQDRALAEATELHDLLLHTNPPGR